MTNSMSCLHTCWPFFKFNYLYSSDSNKYIVVADYQDGVFKIEAGEVVHVLGSDHSGNNNNNSTCTFIYCSIVYYMFLVLDKYSEFLIPCPKCCPTVHASNWCIVT